MHAGKKKRTNDQHTKAKAIPADHDTGHILHPERQQGHRDNRCGRKAYYQFINGRHPVKPGGALDIFSHSCKLTSPPNYAKN
jgi:hypothetical protein